ncbi:hypothetical protein ACLIJJ_25045 [Niallia sp. BSM11]
MKGIDGMEGNSSIWFTLLSSVFLLQLSEFIHIGNQEVLMTQLRVTFLQAEECLVDLLQALSS